MFTRMKSGVSRFINNISQATDYRRRGSMWQSTLHWAFVCLGIVLALFGLLLFLVFMIRWPEWTIGVIVLAAVARVIYAGMHGR